MLSFRKWVVFTFAMHLLVIAIDKGAGLVLLAIVGEQAEVKGAADLMTNVPFILMAVGNLGLATSLVYFGKRKDHGIQEIAETTSFVALAWGGAIGLLAFLALYFVVPTFYPPFADVSVWLYWPLCASVPLLLLQSYGNSLQLATDRIRDYNLVHLVNSVGFLPLFLVAWFALGSETSDVTSSIAFARFANAAFVAVVVLWMISRFVRVRPRLHPAFLRDGLAFGWKANLTSVLTYVNLRIAPYFVVILYARGQEPAVALAAAAKLSIAMSLAELVWHFPEATRDLFFSKVAGSRPEEARVFTPVLGRLCVLMAVGGGVAIIPASMVLIPTLIVGQEAWDTVYRTVVLNCLVLLVPGTTAFTLAKVLQNDLAARGRLDVCIGACLVTTTTMVTGCAVLIPTFGAEGAAASISAAYLASSLFTLVAYTRTAGVAWTSCVFVRASDWVYVQDIAVGVVQKLRRRPSTQP